MNCFTSKSRTHCRECREELSIKGHWYNQLGLEFYLDYIYMWHSIKHNHNITNKVYFVRYFIGMNLKLIGILLLEFLFNLWYIIGIPFRFLFG